MKHITPEILRLAQTHLMTGDEFETNDMWETTCHAIEEASGQTDSGVSPIFQETCDLIHAQLGTIYPFSVIGTADATKEQIQGGRFMYLELLALAIEDGCL
jgi:hypothetical protein